MFLVGCTNNFSGHQIRKIVEICGGHENISEMWKVADVATAYCMDGRLVDQNDK